MPMSSFPERRKNGHSIRFLLRRDISLTCILLHRSRSRKHKNTHTLFSSLLCSPLIKSYMHFRDSPFKKVQNIYAKNQLRLVTLLYFPLSKLCSAFTKLRLGCVASEVAVPLVCSIILTMKVVSHFLPIQ